MHLLRLYQFACLLLLPSVANCADADASRPVKQVAIIGAGAAGSSAAYHLHKYASRDGVQVNITIFEKTARIGGRTLTVDVHDIPNNPVELGASIFVEVNHILFNATKEFALPTTDPGTDEAGLLGVWDGQHFVYTQDSESWGWWNIVKLLWQYGTAPYYTRKLVQETVGTFLKLYEAPYFPFRSLSTRAYQLGLVKITGLTGLQWLAQNKLDGPFAHHIVQTSTRVNYASNLPYIHGLGTMVAMAPEGAMAVAGGNWRIFSHMVSRSNAHVSLNSTVTSIAKKLSSDPESGSPKYSVETKTTGATDNAEAEAYPVAFDDVVIATPYQFSGIDHDAGVIPHPVDSIPYVTLHVTLFATSYRFSPEFFNLDPAARVPTSVLTTLGADEEAKPGREGAGNAGFFSATLVKVVTNPKTQNTEYVYKIFSPDKVTPEFLSRLLGVQVPDTFTRDSSADADGEESETTLDPISWYYPAVFHPYPQKYPRVTFQDPILGDGLYYTSGIESFISTMETSALMGMNVARLIIDDYLGISHADQVGVDAEALQEQEKFQDVLTEQQKKTAEGYGRPVEDAGEL
ncbi:prenylcysteine oxidase [Hypoxylon rubiginosum]|uniref:Prenylcysteine oxidase n=1 Tax=Hypoxylon rubiginosum TaxID=110542 RepID=A0ACB9YKT1_9PEZI|nr:prenylcysteine oxidase [Hypoxylon rubiginosum]